MSSDMLTKRDHRRFISILSSDATFREKVPKGTPDSIEREYEDKKTKTKGVKYELVFNDLRGRITDIEVRDSDYGRQLLTTFSEGENELVLALNTTSPFADDLMKKLPNVDFDHSMWIAPYAMELENGKTRKGLSIKQGPKKIVSYFFDPINKKGINGLPEPENKGEGFNKEDWIDYFTQVRKFLTKYTIENICPRFAGKNKESISYPVDNIQPEDIPF